MSDNGKSGGNGFLYFIVGALVVVVAGLGYYLYSSNGGGSDADLSIEVSEDGIDIDGN